MFRISIVATVLVLTGCAASSSTTHTAGTLVMDLYSETPVSVGVWEQRQDVVSGERAPDWIGLQRSLYGIPYGVKTSSGRPFAEDLNSFVVRSLQRSGIDAEAVAIPLGSDRYDAVKELTATGRNRLLLLRVDEWYSDTYTQPTLHYDLTLQVLDSRGSLVAETSVSGADDLGPRMREERRSTTAATVDILRTLLTRKPIENALSSTDLATTEKVRPCTVEQILQMRETGLSEEQIKRACDPD